MQSTQWRLVVCGTNHRTSSLDILGRLYIENDEIARANAIFGTMPKVFESAILSTCNRVEFYFVTEREVEPFNTVASFYRDLRGDDITALTGNFQTRKGIHAADRLFRVAAGIDSMIIGENQILGQVKSAYSSACSVKTVGKVLHRLFHQAFRVGKQVRTDTEMGKGSCSVSSAAVEMLRERIEKIETPRILFVGVNQMIDLAAKGLSQIDDSLLTFVNRTALKAISLAEKYHAEAFGLEELPRLVSLADVVVTCTSSPVPILSRETLDGLAHERRERRCIIMDLAVPRDVEYPKEPDAPFRVYDLEDIREFMDGAQKKRLESMHQAEGIIAAKLAEFNYWFEHVMHEPIYNGSSAAIESIRREELASLMEKLPPSLQNEITQATRRLIERVMNAAKREEADTQD
jgi:glutamyl-tRNA reductase